MENCVTDEVGEGTLLLLFPPVPFRVSRRRGGGGGGISIPLDMTGAVLAAAAGEPLFKILPFDGPLDWPRGDGAFPPENDLRGIGGGGRPFCCDCCEVILSVRLELLPLFETMLPR